MMIKLILMFFLFPSVVCATPVVKFSLSDQNGLQWLVIEIDGVSEVYGYDLLLRYDTARLAVEDVDAARSGIQIGKGTFLPDGAFEVVNKVDARSGSVHLAQSILNPAPAVSGRGIIALVPFKVREAGPVQLEKLSFGTKNGDLIRAHLPEPVLIRPALSKANAGAQSLIVPEAFTGRTLSSGNHMEHFWVLVLLAIVLLLAVTIAFLMVRLRRQSSSV